MEESEFTHHEPCDKCGSSDALARYTDGHGYCHSCGHHVPHEGQSQTPRKEIRVSKDDKPLIRGGEAIALTGRKLTEETCSKWGYQIADYRDQKVQVANYRNADNQVVAQKVRFANKEFTVTGNLKEAGLFGQHLWRDGGKRIVITEGEIDAMSVSQVQNNRWPVVSIPNGSNGAKKSLSKALEYLLTFEEIILMFDQDEPGQEAAIECAQIFPPGRCKLATLPMKDANEMLKEGMSREIMDAIYGAKTYRPDGIVTIDDIYDDILMDPEEGFPWWIDDLTKLTYGRRPGEIYCFGAGTGVGKTDFLVQQIEYDMTVLKQPVGTFFLEQPPKETAKRIAGKRAGKQFHVPDAGWTTDELKEALDGMKRDSKLHLYNNFGSTDWSIIQNTIRHLAHANDVQLFYIDHLTALAAAEADERVGLERIMAQMASLALELGIIIHLVSHLATPEGTPHEEGGRVMIRHFKGSRSIGFWCHFMFGLERDQQHDNDKLATVITFRVLKDRYTGRATGHKTFLDYDRDKGMLIVMDHDPFAEAEEKSGFDSNEFNEDVPF